MPIRAVDISGCSFLVFNAKFTTPNIGGLTSQNMRHFFESVAANAGINAHLEATGENDHHKVETLFKAFGIALKRAVRFTGSRIPSTKGVL